MKAFTYLAAFAAGLAAAYLLRLTPIALPAAQEPSQETAVVTEAAESTAEATPLPTEAPAAFDAATELWVQTDDGCKSLSLRDYLAGVLAAEMPLTFAPAALESQAVASRTFALKKAEAARHGAADVCLSAACCQGWSDPAVLSAEALETVYAAVDATDGLVALYEGELIDATFFSCSGGRTEAAAAVWGSDIPYLQAVDSPREEAAPRFTETVTLSADELRTKLLTAYPEMELSGSCPGWFGAITYTPGSGIDTVELGGVTVGGTTLRRLLGLRSTRIDLRCTDDTVTLTTLGFGHRVGMSQYGAQAMALEGAGVSEILRHYYPGIELCRLVPAE